MTIFPNLSSYGPFGQSEKLQKFICMKVFQSNQFHYYDQTPKHADIDPLEWTQDICFVYKKNKKINRFTHCEHGKHRLCDI